MNVQVLMPQLGESVEEGTITRWLHQPGDAVAEFEPLLEVNTDKVDTEVPAPAAGVLDAILVPAGTVVRAGTPLAVIAADGGAPSDRAPDAAPQPSVPSAIPSAASATAPSAPAAPVTAPRPGRHPDLGFISPVVARLAQEHALDLSQIRGSGAQGRITKRDVLAYLEAAPSARPEVFAAETGAAAPPVVSAPLPTLELAGDERLADERLADERLADELLPHSGLRQSIAAHMVLSAHTSPHVTTVMEVDLSAVSAHRRAHKDALAQEGIHLTFTAYFLAACAAALRQHPRVNSSWRDDGLLVHRQINLGMATSLGEDGLIVPVIHNADHLSLRWLAAQINDLAARARLRKLKPDEVRGGTFSITNHGVTGSLFATPIINQPQCAILGVGVVQKRVVVLPGDALAIRPMAYLTLTFDHRILDGAAGDRFLGAVVELLQNWPPA
jgi:2-oxoglutarate dehydrogenase E2 component (dihydrolipoamide succinyltransferase)